MSDKQSKTDPAKPVMTGQETYNVITDTVAGPNLRLKDNLIQGVCVLAGGALGAGIGFLVAKDGATGTLVGGFLGVVVGLFASGIYLMIFRAIKHSRGQHD